MSQKKLTEMQTLILWALLAKGGEGFQKDIKPEATKADRTALEREGNIRSEKRGRSIWLEATDTGWRWAAENLGADLPKRSTAGTLVLRDWLTLLKVFMVARNVTLADILGPQPKIKPGAPRDDYAVRRDRVRKAYLELTGGNLNKSVLLSDLREQTEGHRSPDESGCILKEERRSKAWKIRATLRRRFATRRSVSVAIRCTSCGSPNERCLASLSPRRLQLDTRPAKYLVGYGISG